MDLTWYYKVGTYPVKDKYQIFYFYVDSVIFITYNTADKTAIMSSVNKGKVIKI